MRFKNRVWNLLLIAAMLFGLLNIGFGSVIAKSVDENPNFTNNKATILDVIINEADADTPGTDVLEFVELYDGGDGGTPLDGLTVVFFNGSTNLSYYSVDLDGYSTDANGYFVLGNAGVSPQPSIIFPSNGLQNGQDAIAVYNADATLFPVDTIVTTTNLVDALVYDTSDADDPELLVLLNPGQPQVDENSNINGANESNQRCPNGSGGARNTDTYLQSLPTPGLTNNCPSIIINEADADTDGTDILEFVELYDGGFGNIPLDGLTVVFFNGSSDLSYYSVDLDGYSTDTDGYFVLGNSAVIPTPSIIFDGNFLQNGQDAIAIFNADATDFPTNTAVTTTNLIDALVYDTNDADDPGLLVLLNASQPQVDESGNGNSARDSNQRCPNGSGGARNTDTYLQFLPTPGSENTCIPNEPIIPICPASITTYPGVAASDNFSATDADGVVVDASITAGGVTGISITNLVAATVVGGELTGTLDVADTTAEGTYPIVITFSNNDDPDTQTATCTVPVTVVPTTCPLTDTYQIGDVQGETDTSPLVNSSVTVSGVVVADFQDTLSGYYLQDPDGDGNDNTSDGIFVYNFSYPVSVGDPVQFTGSVSEYNGLTELSGVSEFSICGTQQTIVPTVLSLPVTDLNDFEKYESMLVTFPQDLVISEYYNFGRYGEIVLTSDRFLTPTAEFEPGTDSIAAADNFLLNKITLDDGRSNQNPDPAIHPNGNVFDMTNLFRGGDLVTNVTGALDYKFGLWRIQPTQGADYTNTNVRTALPADVGGNIKVASFNVLNYFTTLDNGVDDICGPSQDMECRGADTAEELSRQRAKIIAAISAINADVVGLMEIENNITDDAVIDLVAGLNDAMGVGTYDYVASGAIGTDAIKVAMIYKPATVNLIGDYAVLDSSVDSRFLDDKNRPTLAQTFQDAVNGGYVTVAVNHLKSKGSDCLDVGDPDLGDGAGNCNLTRKAAAEAMVDWLASDPTGAGDGDYLIIGDLNSYDKEDPIDAILRGSDDVMGTYDDYTDMVYTMIGEDAYSYVFDGQTGYLDHALANTALVPQITGTTIWHINADEPSLIDYDMSFKQPAQDALYAPDAYRSSDHDPVIIGLDLTQFSMSPVEVTVIVLPGENVKIPITISNHGLTADTYDIVRLPDSLSISIGFPTVVGPINPGESFTFDATVVVTENEPLGSSKTYVLQATSRNHGSSLTSTINILVGYLHIYFPMIFK